MNTKSKNGLDLIRMSADKIKGNWGRVFLATLIYVAPLVLFCAIPYAGWAISFALFGYLTLGYINFMQQTMAGNKPSFKVLFVQPEFAQAVMLGIIMCVGVVIGTVLFIIPGIVVIGYYSFSLFVLNEEKIVNVTDTLHVCTGKMQGNKTAMFAYKVIFYLGYALIGVASIIGLMFIAELYATNLALGIILTVLVSLVAIAVISIITMYMYAANVVFYDEIVRPTVVEETTETKEEPATEVVEEAKVEEEKAEEPAPKKTTTRKTTKKTTKE